MKFSKFLEWRKCSLLLCGIIFHLLKLNPFRKKDIWLFGAWIGKKYADNAKFLFEYVNQNHKEIRCVWITRNQKVCVQVKSLGYECYTSTSIKGILMMLRGGVSFFTNGLDDFCAIPLVAGSKVVALWHGIAGFKKIYNENYSGKKLKIKKGIDKFFNWVGRNFSIGTSEYTAELVEEQFGVKRESVLITGQPRNDIFKQHIDKNEVLKNVLDDDYSKVILYMPTYRVNPKTKKDEVKIILENLNSNQNFKDFLQQHKILFLAKLHPLTDFRIKPQINNIKILGDKSVSSVEQLLMSSDVLITDYSSCCVDFALLRKPVVFYVPDETEYLSYSSVNTAYKRVTQEKVKNVDDLVFLLKNVNMNSTNLLNELFEDKSIAGTCYSENVYQKVCERIAL